MKIAINAQLLSTDSSYRGAGVSNYSRHLLTALGALTTEAAYSDLALTAYVNAPDFVAEGISLKRSRLPLHRPLARIAWEQSVLPLRLRLQRPALIHGFVNVLPLATTVPGVVTVHDLSFVRTPELLPAAKRWYLTQLCRASVAKARQVIAVSRQTADDLLHYFGVPAAKVHVIHNGIAPHFTPQPALAIHSLRRRHNLPERFFLYVGTLEPRKNLPLLIRAYARWRKQAAPANQEIKLVLAGGKGWFYNEIFRLVTALELTDQILFPGFVPDAELATWYSAALAFIYPSQLEGFGLPVLEAMACGTPVLCSQIPSLCEITGDQALHFPVADPEVGEETLVDLLQQVVTDSALMTVLRNDGLAHAANFSWRRTALATAELYRSL